MEGTLKWDVPLGSARMRITGELFPAKKEFTAELGPDATGMDLLRALKLAPDAHLLVRGDTPIPLDDALTDGERLRVIAVVSGGRA